MSSPSCTAVAQYEPRIGPLAGARPRAACRADGWPVSGAPSKDHEVLIADIDLGAHA